jgi:hypothetical protein
MSMWTKLSLAVAMGAAITLFAGGAQAQQKAPEKAAPAAKAAPKPKSLCNSLTDEAACKANDTCSWIAALTDAKTGKQKRKAYCRTKPTPPVKKAKDAPKK